MNWNHCPKVRERCEYIKSQHSCWKAMIVIEACFFKYTLARARKKHTDEKNQSITVPETGFLNNYSGW